MVEVRSPRADSPMVHIGNLVLHGAEPESRGDHNEDKNTQTAPIFTWSTIFSTNSSKSSSSSSTTTTCSAGNSCTTILAGSSAMVGHSLLQRDCGQFVCKMLGFWPLCSSWLLPHWPIPRNWLVFLSLCAPICTSHPLGCKFYRLIRPDRRTESNWHLPCHALTLGCASKPMHILCKSADLDRMRIQCALQL